MPVFKKKSGEKIVEEFTHCKSFLRKARGLMFSGKKILLFEFKGEKLTPLHMFFVFFSIDVLFIDKNKIVVEIKKDLRPFSFYFPKNKSKFIIEAPAGIVDNKKIELGEELEII